MNLSNKQNELLMMVSKFFHVDYYFPLNMTSIGRVRVTHAGYWNLELAPKALYCGVHRDFLFYASIGDDTDANLQNRTNIRHTMSVDTSALQVMHFPLVSNHPPTTNE